MNNTEKNFLDNFYNDMNSKFADYKNEDDDIVVYDSFSEIKDKQFMSEDSRRNHEIINSHEVFNEEYFYNNFNLIRMKQAVESELIIMPDDINTPEDIRNFILSHADIQLKNIDDNDKIEVIKSLLDNK
jgi:hypothetical protein